jgi:dihydroorotate dehydrogenase
MDLSTTIGRITLKNPIICGSGEHVMWAAGMRRALDAGAAAVVAKSVNESQAARDQLDRADYVLLDSRWRPLPWDFDPPRESSLACRSGLTPQPFDAWLDTVAALDREARAQDAYVIASVILSGLEPAVEMARQIEAAGVRILEFNVGVPYADEAVQGAVTTERVPAKVAEQVAAIRAAVRIPVWVKITGQSERVDNLAAAARQGGADAVVLMGRFLGFVPDVETQRPVLDTNLGLGGFWSLPLVCYWLARSRAALGPEFPLIGTNGVRDGLDVVRFLLAGASAAEMSTAVLAGGFETLSSALAQLESYVAEKETSVSALIGAAADRLQRFEDLPPRPGNFERYLPPGAMG